MTLRTIRPVEGRWASYSVDAEVRSMLQFMSHPEAVVAARQKQAAHLVGGHGNAWWKKVSRILEHSHGRFDR